MKVIKMGLIFLLLFSFLMVPQALINQDFLHEQMHKLFQIEVRSAFSGGERVKVFRDSLGDVTVRNGHDILSLSLYEPQRDESWSDSRIYWQLSYRFETLDMESLRLQHYFNFMDERDIGSQDTAVKRAELVTFNKDYPWQYVISIYGDKVYISNYDNTWEEQLVVNLDHESNTLYLRIPLDYAPLRRVYRSIDSFHYLITGLYDPVSRGKFRVLDRDNIIKPKITDYLVPKGMDQDKLLSSYNLDDFSYVDLYPVIFEEGSSSEEEISDSEIRAVLDSLVQAEIQERSRAVSLFNDGEYRDAEELFRENLNKNRDSVIDMAYMGSIIAMRAGESDSVSESVELVLEAYDYLDRAVELAESDAEKIETYMNRINVSLAVPDSVFHKEEQALSDLFSVIDMLDEKSDLPLVLECYWKILKTHKKSKRYDEYYIYRDHLLNLLNRSGIGLSL